MCSICKFWIKICHISFVYEFSECFLHSNSKKKCVVMFFVSKEFKTHMLCRLNSFRGPIDRIGDPKSSSKSNRKKHTIPYSKNRPLKMANKINYNICSNVQISNKRLAKIETKRRKLSIRQGLLAVYLPYHTHHICNGIAYHTDI